jgi:3-methylcrotonyl-CoA carboxylase alpha subunit
MRIKKVFIANRGEVVRRIACSANKLGIKTVCLVSQDGQYKYLSEVVDELIIVEEENVSLYLDHDKMLSFAKKSGCDAIHPGFGFLSENFSFAKKVTDSGFIWIGPPAEVIKIMADKSEAAKIASYVNVPRPSSVDAFRVDEKFTKKDISKIESIGFPLIVKAAFGGGGKGMRLLHSKDNLLEELQRASSEAQRSFADGLLLAEKYIEKSRHIEVQILVDSFANIKVLGERDCSVQRRHQKIVEEAPALGLSDKTRSALHKAAQKIAQKVNYVSCGTVEFLLDCSNSKEDQDFYFLEMNTRLQVEHPVSEELFSIDIVEWQFRIAQGEKLEKNFNSSDIHAIEARIYAEDPENNFLPAPGFLTSFKPFYMSGVRWELGADKVTKVSEKFDPMLAKVVVKSDSRVNACKLMVKVLEKTFIAGLKSNRELLLEIFKDEKFTSKPVTSSYLPERLSSLLKSLQNKKDNISQKLGLSRLRVSAFKSKDLLSPLDNIYSESAWNNKISLNKEELYSFKGISIVTGYFLRQGQIVNYACWQKDSQWYLSLQCCGYGWEIVEKKQIWRSKRETREKNKILKSHVPGRIIKVLVSSGQKIKKEEICFVLESMKMEFAIKVDHDSIIKNVFIKENEYVDSGRILAELE